MSAAGWGRDAAVAAAGVIRARTGAAKPALAITLGSGLGTFADRIAGARTVDYADVPGFFPPTVEGHSGRVIVGTVGGREVIAFAGRFHVYEGHTPRAAAFPVRVAHALGAKAYFASNAAGGLDRSLVAGDLVLIEDHLNLTGTSPLIGPVEPGDVRFPDLTKAHSPRLRAAMREAAADAKVALKAGVYAGLNGPAYETPAEVRMLAALGATVTGMSTVHEAIVAATVGIEFVGVSLVTNLAAGLTDAPVRHEDVMEAANVAAARFASLVEAFVRRV